MTPRREDALRPAVAETLRKRGCRVRHEVAFNERIADLVGVDGETVVAVELKLEDWRTALTQARAYQVGAPRSYVALPIDLARDVAEEHGEAFEEPGVGLLGVDPPGTVRTLIEARISDRTLPFLKAAIRDKVNGGQQTF